MKKKIAEDKNRRNCTIRNYNGIGVRACMTKRRCTLFANHIRMNFANDDHFYSAGTPYLRITHMQADVQIWWMYDANMYAKSVSSNGNETNKTEEKIG